jgi:hypothetical protein
MVCISNFYFKIQKFIFQCFSVLCLRQVYALLLEQYLKRAYYLVLGYVEWKGKGYVPGKREAGKRYY